VSTRRRRSQSRREAELLGRAMNESRRGRAKTILFSYGSNDLEQLSDRLGRRIKKPESWRGGVIPPGVALPAFLPEHGRVFRGMSRNWGGGVASIEWDPERVVFGYVTKVSIDDLDFLDRYEGVGSGNYERAYFSVLVESDNGELEKTAVAYVSTSNRFRKPTREYLKAVASTISKFWSGQDGARVTWKDIKVS